MKWNRDLRRGCGAPARPHAPLLGAAAAAALGTVTIWPQPGHLAFLPAAESGAVRVLPHDAQFTLMGTNLSFFGWVRLSGFGFG